MIGISRYGAYIPPTRLSLRAIGGGVDAGQGGPEKATAWNDEDAITMAVAAGRHCLRDCARERVDGLFFASTTHVYHEKQAAALIARALDLDRNIQSADFSHSLRAGTTALRSACDAVKAGTSRNVLVIASDCRMAAPGSPMEAHLGDGAVAFLVSDEHVIAQIQDGYSISDEIVDVWRGEGEPFSHSWEDRFVIQEGYVPRISEVLEGLLAKTQRTLNDYQRVILYGPDQRNHALAIRSLGVDSERVQDPLFGRVGNTGAAFANMQLAQSLEVARPGDRILLANYGDGAEAISLEITKEIENIDDTRGVSWHLDRRRPVLNYDRYLKARGLGSREWPSVNGPGLSATVHFRERDDNLSFRGQQCRKCQSVQFPNQRVCERCFAKDAFDPARLADRVGSVVTYTLDYFFPTPDPPTIVAVVEIDGARVHLQIVDCPPEDVRIGMPVEFSFRRIHEAGGRPNYYWKGIPVASKEALSQAQ